VWDETTGEDQEAHNLYRPNCSAFASQLWRLCPLTLISMYVLNSAPLYGNLIHSEDYDGGRVAATTSYEPFGENIAPSWSWVSFQCADFMRAPIRSRQAERKYNSTWAFSSDHFIPSFHSRSRDCAETSSLLANKAVITTPTRRRKTHGEEAIYSSMSWFHFRRLISQM
jgi:hypothetical protein